MEKVAEYSISTDLENLKKGKQDLMENVQKKKHLLETTKAGVKEFEDLVRQRKQEIEELKQQNENTNKLVSLANDAKNVNREIDSINNEIEASEQLAYYDSQAHILLEDRLMKAQYETERISREFKFSLERKRQKLKDLQATLHEKERHLKERKETLAKTKENIQALERECNQFESKRQEITENILRDGGTLDHFIADTLI
eukprot:Nk52_evm17s360 gene=Nk52_evmTU17s360